MQKKEVDVIIIAMEEEFALLKERIKDISKVNRLEDLEYYSFERNKENYIALIGKVGKVNTGFFLGKLSLIFKIKRIINIGTSGGYSPLVKVGDIVIAERTKYLDVDATGADYELGQVPRMPSEFICDSLNHKKFRAEKYNVHYGLICSSDSFMTMNNYKNFPIEKFNPLCVEMESTAVAHCAYLLKVPCIIIRSISDIITREDNNSEMDRNLHLAAKNCVDVLFQII